MDRDKTEYGSKQDRVMGRDKIGYGSKQDRIRGETGQDTGRNRLMEGRYREVISGMCLYQRISSQEKTPVRKVNIIIRSLGK